MSTRRSSSRRSRAGMSRNKEMKPSTKRGFESLVKGNESYISKILSIDTSRDNNGVGDQMEAEIVNAIEDCMSMNNLTAEMLLARFFDTAVLSTYSQDVLGKSGKGSAATLAARIAKEWSKDDFRISASSKRKRGEDTNENASGKAHKPSQAEELGGHHDEHLEEDDDDWKRPLFFWKGRLIQNELKSTLQWSGSWVAGLAEDGLPEEEQYEKSKEVSAFELVTAGKIKQKDKQEESGITSDPHRDSILQSLTGLCGKLKGKYLLDQGDGLGPRDFRDLSHHFVFDSHIQSSKLVHGEKIIVVVGWGSTEFGNFVSAGYAHLNNLDFTELILARRYIADDDSRQEKIRKRDFKGLLQVHQDDNSRKFWTNMLPWKS